MTRIPSPPRQKPVGTGTSFDVLYLGNYHVACWQLAHSSLLKARFIASHPAVIHKYLRRIYTLRYTGGGSWLGRLPLAVCNTFKDLGGCSRFRHFEEFPVNFDVKDL
jgi:hypothetical protein